MHTSIAIGVICIVAVGVAVLKIGDRSSAKDESSVLVETVPPHQAPPSQEVTLFR